MNKGENMEFTIEQILVLKQIDKSLSPEEKAQYKLIDLSTVHKCKKVLEDSSLIKYDRVFKTENGVLKKADPFLTPQGKAVLNGLGKVY